MADLMEKLGAVHLHLADGGALHPGEIAEETGRLRAWLAERSAAAVLVRPDKYVFGLAANRDGLEALCRELLTSIFGEDAGLQASSPQAQARARGSTP
jgi:hypothetical protein